MTERARSGIPWTHELGLRLSILAALAALVLLCCVGCVTPDRGNAPVGTSEVSTAVAATVEVALTATASGPTPTAIPTPTATPAVTPTPSPQLPASAKVGLSLDADGYDWHRATREERIALCKRHEANWRKAMGFSPGWDWSYLFFGLEEFYNTTDPMILKQKVAEISALLRLLWE